MRRVRRSPRAVLGGIPCTATAVNAVNAAPMFRGSSLGSFGTSGTGSIHKCTQRKLSSIVHLSIYEPIVSIHLLLLQSQIRSESATASSLKPVELFLRLARQKIFQALFEAWPGPPLLAFSVGPQGLTRKTSTFMQVQGLVLPCYAAQLADMF